MPCSRTPRIDIPTGIAPDALHRALLVGYGHSGAARGLPSPKVRYRSMDSNPPNRQSVPAIEAQRHSLPSQRRTQSGHALFIRGKGRKIPIHPSGNSPCMACRNAFARSGNARPYAEILLFHSVSADYRDVIVGDRRT